MLILAHRGCAAHALENTLEAFQEAIALDIDGIETDVRLSADSVPILFHDRLTPDGRAVSSLSQDELSACVGYPVPSLEAALQLPVTETRDWLWNLELKTPLAVEATVEILSRHTESKRGESRRFLITSFWHPAIQEISQRLDVDCGVLVAHRPLDFRLWLNWLPSHPYITTIVWRYETLDADCITQSAACGLRNFVYGVITPGEHQRLVDWELDGIITDHPEYCLWAR